MSQPQLLAIVEVPHDARVRCQADGCNHSVFRRIHVVRDESGFHVYGSECFKKIFAGSSLVSSTPAYTATSGHPLTEEERQLLIENTERFILQLEGEYHAAIAEKAANLIPPREITPSTSPPLSHHKTLSITTTANLSIEKQAKELVQAKYGVNPDLPGWRGLVLE